MKCRYKARDTRERARGGRDDHAPHDDGHRTGTSATALALFAGIVAGACLAQSWYQERKARERRAERRDRIERWEGEGGALPGSVGAATPPPSGS